MTGEPSTGSAADSHPFICRGCHVRYSHGGQCQICGSEIVIEAEWPTDPVQAAARMRAPEPKRHELIVVFALVAVTISVVLAWGEATLWGVVPCGVASVAFLLVPITPWRGRDAGEELGDYLKAAPFDGHAMQDGLARQAAVTTTPRVPIGCLGLVVGVILPLATIRPGSTPTIVAGVTAMVGFLLAWIRRHWREAEASAGRGVPQ
jgi:hypothetical protein